MNRLQRTSWRLMTAYKVKKLHARVHAVMHRSEDPRLIFIFGCRCYSTNAWLID